MGGKAPPRLLFLEFLCNRVQRSDTAMFFPFLQGAARDCGAATLWLYLAAEPRFFWERPTGRTLRAHLPEDGLLALSRRARRFRPTHIVSNEIPSAPLGAALVTPDSPKFMVLPSEFDAWARRWAESQREMDPYLSLFSGSPQDREFFHKPAWFLDWLGAGRHPKEAEGLLDAAEPVYEAERGPGGEDGGCQYPLLLAGGRSCKGRPSVAGNPRFHGLAEAAQALPGCSFCGGSGTWAYHRKSSLSLVEKQLRRIEEAGASGRGRGCYTVYDMGLFLRIDEFFGMIHKNRFQPGKFSFTARIDDILRTRGRVEAAIPLAAARGHRIGFDVMGIENFSPEAMVLYNKSISVAQADELVALMERWRRDWPGVFDPFHGGKDWLMLLFTPWTTISELRLNYDEAARRGFGSRDMWLATSLLLRKDTALAALAEREGGIIAAEFEDRGLEFFPIFGMHATWGSIPWRFKDSRVADVFRILIRLYVFLGKKEAHPLFGGDPEFGLFARIYCGAPGKSLDDLPRPPWDLLAVARTLLDLIEGAPEPCCREALLREAVARVGKEVKVSGPLAGENPVLSGPLTGAESEAIGEIGRRLKSGSVRPLRGLLIKASEADLRGGRAIRLRLVIDGKKVALSLRDRESPEPFYFQTRRFKVAYLGESPAWTPTEDAARRLRLLVAWIERRLSAAAPK